MADSQSLPVPPSMSPTQKAKIDDDALPVGGAPPVQIPSFEQALPQNAVPQQTQQTQLPPNHPPPRSPEEIKRDFDAAMNVISRGQFTDPKNTPETAVPLQDAVPQPAQQAQQQGKQPDIPANSPQPAPPPPPPEPEPEPVDEGPTIGDLRDFPMEGYRQAVERVDFNDDRLKKAIEDRCEEVPVENLILYESVSQKHIIIPGKLEVVFRTLTASEDLAIKDEMYKVQGSDRYVLDTLNLLQLTCGLRTFNNSELPTHLSVDEAGNSILDPDRLKVKLDVVKRLPLQIVGLLSVAYYWYDERIRKILVNEVLGKS